MSELYLIHSAKGSQRANHKYIDRVWKNGRWQYIYTHKDSIGTRGQYSANNKIDAIRKSLKDSNSRYNGLKNNKEYVNFAYKNSKSIVRNATNSVMKDAKRLRDAKESTAKYKIKTALGTTSAKAKAATKLTKTTGGFNEGKKNNQKWVDISNKNGAGVTLYKGSNRDNKYTGLSVGKAKDDYKYVERTKKLGKYTYVYDNENGTHNVTLHKDHDPQKEAKKRSQAEAKRYKAQRKAAGVPNKIQNAINTAKVRSRRKK